ncbi:MAG: ribokinase [Pseudomonadota bacterium]
MTSVTVIGSVNLDISAKVKRLPAPGETVTGATLSRFPGGKGANQALAARRLGASVRLLACVGDDSTADEALALLREDGVGLDGLIVDSEAATGTALISVADNGENHIVVAPGANRKLFPEAVGIDSADAMICQLEVPGEVIAHACHSFDGFVCVNLAPAREIDVSVLQRADLIVVNEVESDWYGPTLQACSGIVATTFGAAGAVLEKNGGEIARSAAPRVNAVDTVGAGDAFTAALTVSLVEGQSPLDALNFACSAGALAATRAGAQPSLPTRSEVESLLEPETQR